MTPWASAWLRREQLRKIALIQWEPLHTASGLVHVQLLTKAFCLTPAPSSCSTPDPHEESPLDDFFKEISRKGQKLYKSLRILQKVETVQLQIAREVQEELDDLQLVAKEILTKKSIGLSL